MALIVCVVVALFALYLFLIAPGRRGKDFSALRGCMYAHRGLHDNEHGVPENSLAAFHKAVEAGYGIELDVQLTADGQLAVFHDGNLSRMCGVDAHLKDLAFSSAAQYRLLSTGEHIPLFSQVLELVGGRVPLIVEIKHYGNVVQLARQVQAELSLYNGPYCVESFHPLAMRWYKKHAAHVIRGQLASGVIRREEPYAKQAALKYLLVNVLSRPDFIAYDIRSGQNASIFLLRRLFRPLWVAWTVRSREEQGKAVQGYDLQIFEGFTPGH